MATTFTDLVRKGFKIVKSIAMDSIAFLTGGIAGVLIWRTAQSVEAAIRCDCGDCVAEKAWPFGVGEVLFEGHCQTCQEDRKCSVSVTDSLSAAATGLDVGEMLQVTGR